MVLRFCRFVLESRQDLILLEAGCAEEAIGCANRITEKLISSLPIFVCPALAARSLLCSSRRRARVRVLTMSGFPADYHVFRRDWQFIAKPFTPTLLLTKVEYFLETTLSRALRTHRCLSIDTLIERPPVRHEGRAFPEPAPVHKTRDAAAQALVRLLLYLSRKVILCNQFPERSRSSPHRFSSGRVPPLFRAIRTISALRRKYATSW
jgi:hypothetical protein